MLVRPVAAMAIAYQSLSVLTLLLRDNLTVLQCALSCDIKQTKKSAQNYVHLNGTISP